MSTDTVKVGQVWRDKDKRRNTVIEILEGPWIEVKDDTETSTVTGLVVGTEEERQYTTERLLKRWELIEEKAQEPEHVLLSEAVEAVRDQEGKLVMTYSDREVEVQVPQRARPKQTTYMRKLTCAHDEGYKLRITKKMLEEYGYPSCPCHGDEMEEG